MKTNNSKDSERRLQDAMNRLLGGVARYCDGRLTKTNLAREAGVSQATLYRAKNILADWDKRVSETTPRNAQVSRLETELSKSRRRVRDLEQQNSRLRHQITAASTVIAELAARLEQSSQGDVIPLRKTSAEEVS